MKVYTLYVLLDPRSRAIRYVGKTQQKLTDRFYRHLRDARDTNDRTHRANWVRNLLKEGLKPEIFELNTYDTLRELNEAEKFFIKHIRAVDSERPGNRLTNATSGGDGCVVPRKPVIADTVVLQEYADGLSSKKIAKKYHTCAKRVLCVLKKYNAIRKTWRNS